MPKVNPYTDAISQSIRGTIGAVMYALDMTQADMAAEVGIGVSTFIDKMKDVRRWKVSELERIVEMAGKRGYKCQFRIGKGI